MTLKEVFEQAQMPPESTKPINSQALQAILSIHFHKWVNALDPQKHFSFTLVEDQLAPRGISVKVSYTEQHPGYIPQWKCVSSYIDYESSLCPVLRLRLGKEYRPKQPDGKRPLRGYSVEKDYTPEEFLSTIERTLGERRNVYLDELERYTDQLERLGLCTAELRMLARTALHLKAYTDVKNPFELWSPGRIGGSIFDLGAMQEILSTNPYEIPTE